MSGCFSPFPHGTCALSVTRKYLALRGGPRRFPQNYTCSVVLRILIGGLAVSSTGLSPSLVGFSKTIPLPLNFVTPRCILNCTHKSYNTSATAIQICNVDKGLGSFAFARRYLQNRGFFLFLQVLRCFNSLSIAHLSMLPGFAW